MLPAPPSVRDGYPPPQAYRQAVSSIDDYRVALRGYNQREDYRANMPTLGALRGDLVRAELEFLDIARQEAEKHRLT